MKVVSVINYKGGVGKTTLTACLASYLQDLRAAETIAEKPVRVLLVDLDAQCNLTCSVLPEGRWKGLYPNLGQLGNRKTLREWYYGLYGGEEEKLENLILPERYYHIIPSHLELLDVDMKLAVQIAQPNPDDPPFQFVNVLGKLRSELRLIGKTGKYDVALLDCPPNFNIVTQTAILASDAMLVPVQPNPIAVMGIDHLIRRSGDLVARFNNNAQKVSRAAHSEPDIIGPKMLGVVFTMRRVVKGNKAIKAMRAIELALETDLRSRGIPILGRIRHNAKLFAENRPLDILNSSTPGPVYEAVRDNVWKTCRKIGQALEITSPPVDRVEDYVETLVSSPVKNAAAKAGFEIAEAMRHLPQGGAELFAETVVSRILKVAKLADNPDGKSMAEEIVFHFWRHRGHSSDDAERKRIEFRKKIRSD